MESEDESFRDVVGYSISTDGTIVEFRDHADLFVASQKDVKAILYLVDGLGEEGSRPRQDVKLWIPGIQEEYLNSHSKDSLSRIDCDISSGHMFFAKWSRVASQLKTVWKRERRYREGNPFNLNGRDPVAARLDHEKYSHFSQPYRSYDPILEYTDEESHFLNKSLAPDGARDDGHKRWTKLLTVRSDLEKAAHLAAKKEKTEKNEQEDPEGVQCAPKKRLRVIRHAIRDCVSLYHDRVGEVEVGILCFDPIHRHRCVEVKYDIWKGGTASEISEEQDSFTDEESTRHRFIRIFGKQPPSMPNTSPFLDVRKVIGELVLEDQIKLMSNIGEALDEMELSVAGMTYERWRHYVPPWRNHLFHQIETLTYLRDVLFQGETQHSQGRLIAKKGSLQDRVRTTQARVETLLRRLEGTYQVLTSTMSIIESEKAIQEAEEVSKLTNLAFFFIPLTLVTGIFGMNLVEFDNTLTSWMWVAASLLTTVLTYFVRYRRPISHALMESPEAIRKLRWDAYTVRLHHLTQMLRAAPPILVAGLLVVGFGIGLWQVTTCGLGFNARLGLSIAMSGLPTACALNLRKVLISFPRSTSILLKITALAVYAAVGISIWKLSISSLPTNDKIGIGFGAIGVTTFVLPPVSPPMIIVDFLDSVLPYPAGDARASKNEKSFWQHLTLAVTHFVITGVMGVAIWKLLTSSLPDNTKIGIMLGAMGVPLFLLALTLDDDNSLLFVLLAIGVCFALAIWKLATSLLSDNAKLGLGALIVCGPVVVATTLDAV